MEKIYVVTETLYVDGEEYNENAPYPTFPHKYEIAYCKTEELAREWFWDYVSKNYEEDEIEKQYDGTVKAKCSSSGDESLFKLETREVFKGREDWA